MTGIDGNKYEYTAVQVIGKYLKNKTVSVAYVADVRTAEGKRKLFEFNLCDFKKIKEGDFLQLLISRKTGVVIKYVVCDSKTSERLFADLPSLAEIDAPESNSADETFQLAKADRNGEYHIDDKFKITINESYVSSNSGTEIGKMVAGLFLTFFFGVMMMFAGADNLIALTVFILIVGVIIVAYYLEKYFYKKKITESQNYHIECAKCIRRIFNTDLDGDNYEYTIVVGNDRGYEMLKKYVNEFEYEITKEGDPYYLAVAESGTVLGAYNCKMYKLSESLAEKLKEK